MRGASLKLSQELSAGLDQLAKDLNGSGDGVVRVPPQLVRAIDQSFSKSISQALDAVSTRERCATVSALNVTLR